MSDEPMSSDISNDDKLWAALAYVFTPFVPVLLLLLEDKKDRPYIRAHNVQALAWGVGLWALVSVTIPLFGLGLCIGPLGFLVTLFWAFKAYQGEEINIPLISDFVKGQGWA